MITGSLKDVARPESTLKVKNVDVLMMRAPVPSDFSIGSEHLVKAEESGYLLHNATAGSPASSQHNLESLGCSQSDRISVAQNWRSLLHAGDALEPADENEDTDLVKYIGIMN